MLPQQEESPRKLARWESCPSVSSHRGKPRTIPVSLRPPPSKNAPADEEEEDNLHLQKLIALARLPFCPETRTFGPAPLSVAATPSPPPPPPRPPQPSPILATGGRGRDGTAKEHHDGPRPAVAETSTAAPRRTLNVESRSRGEDEDEGESLDSSRVEGEEGDSADRRAPSPILLMDESEDGDGGDDGDNMSRDVPDDTTFIITAYALESLTGNDRIVEENRAFAASQFGLDPAYVGGAAAGTRAAVAPWRDGPRKCRICGMLVVWRHNQDLLCHATSTTCLFRRVVDRLRAEGGANRPVSSGETTATATKTAPPPSKDANSVTRLVERFGRGSRAMAAARQCWESHFDEEVVGAATGPSSKPSRCRRRWRCRKCRRIVAPLLPKHVVACVGIGSAVRALEDALRPVVERALLKDTTTTKPGRRRRHRKSLPHKSGGT